VSALGLGRALTLIGYLGTFALLVIWYGWLSPPSHVPVEVALLVLGVPLLLPLRGLLHGRTYTHQWSLFLSLIYFAHGVSEAWTVPADRPYAVTEIVLVTLWFTGAVLYVRQRRDGR